ncbi:MAG: TVP38/TMEM64 family protein, partial [Candidatus Coproplasma sp.]
PLTATLIASAGAITGSVIAYVLGKYCGKPLVVWIAGKETTEKYTNILSKKGKILFLMMQILPFFPDDIICIVAGLTCMNFAFFMATIVVVRPAIIAMYCYLGSGTIIPFSGWGIPVWIAIFAVCIILAVLSFKYQDKVETWLVKKFKRKKGDKFGGDKNAQKEEQDNTVDT